MKSETKDSHIITAKFGRPKLFPKVEIKNLVLLSIIGNKECTGDCLGAIVTRAVTNNPNIEFTTFLIADEIHWHNLKNAEKTSHAEEIQLRENAMQLGAEYFESQLQYFLSPLNLTVSEFNRRYPTLSANEKLRIINDISKKEAKRFEIIFWRDWISRAPDIYTQNQTAIFDLYYTEEYLQKSITERASKFAEKHTKEGDSALLTLRSKGYLREESPAIMLLAAYLKYNFITYPGSMPLPFKATRVFFIKNSKDKSTVCNDKYSKYYLYSDNPEQLVNWQEVSFPPVIQGNKNQLFASLNKPLKADQQILEFGNCILQDEKLDHKGVVLGEYVVTVSTIYSFLVETMGRLILSAVNLDHKGIVLGEYVATISKINSFMVETMGMGKLILSDENLEHKGVVLGEYVATISSVCV